MDRPQVCPDMTLTFDEHRTAILHQTALLTAVLPDADVHAPVPSCPGWTVGRLARHLGAGQSWAAELVRSRAGAPLPDDDLRAEHRPLDDDPAGLVGLLDDASRELAATLADAGSDGPVWTPTPDGRAAFFARRFAHETLVHRADAVLALGLPFAAARAVLVDAVQEWLELETMPQQLDVRPARRSLLGRGATIGLVATDAQESWMVDLTGDSATWRPGCEPCAATLHAPLADLLLILYRRRPLPAVKGRADLVTAWLDAAAFG